MPCALLSFAAASLLAAADTLVVNASLPTVPGAEAIAIDDGRVLAVGKASEVARLADSKTTRIDARGRIVLPGLIDSHVHFASGGQQLRRVELRKLPLPEVLARIKTWAAENPQAPWILGRGWQYELFQGRTPPYPTRQELDALGLDRPIFVRAYDGHTGWANSRALGACGIDARTADPKDGTFIREADGKTPSGALVEGAMDAIFSCLPKPTQAELERAILDAQDLALSLGLTAVNDFTADTSAAAAYQALAIRSQLKVKVFFSPPLETPLAEVKALRERFEKHRPLLRLGSLKGFVDGVIESETAAMLEPYTSNPKTSGSLHLDAAALARLVGPADKAGFAVSLHCVGDRAVRTALDAFARAAKENGSSGRRHRVEHIEILDPKDTPRFAQLGVVASMQPFHAELNDDPGQEVWEANIGRGRWPRAWPWRSMLAEKVPLAFGSDWTVTTLDPLKGLGVAMGRTTGRGLPKGGWIPEQRLSFAEAVAAYTTGAAWGLRAENELGQIAVGRAADLIILSEKVDPKEPLSVYWGVVDLTMIDGEVVFARGAR